MAKEIVKKYSAEGMCCPNDAEKAQSEISKLDYIKNASVDYVNKSVFVTVDEEIDSKKVDEAVEEAAKKYNFKVKSIENGKASEKIIYLPGLDCADCANKIEDRVKKIPEVETAEVDFMMQRLKIKVKNEDDLPKALRQATSIVNELEPDIKVSYTSNVKDDSEEKELKKQKTRKTLLIIGAVLFFGAFFIKDETMSFATFFVSYVLIGYDIVLKAVRNIFKGEVFDENFLMTIATIGAFGIGEYPEGVAVMLFYQVGEAFQTLAVNRSRKSIESLMDIRPDYANLKIGDDFKVVPPEEVGVGDIILVKPGEKVPVDGDIVDGMSALDTSALTGESLPRDVGVGDSILSGSINKNGLITVKVTKAFGESTVTKILDLVQNASSKKAEAENFITKFARYYTPIVTFMALALMVFPPMFIEGATYSEWIYKGLSFLVVSCPCALVISVPLSFFSGIGSASKHGILIKGSNYLEALNDVTTVVMDKTGTITEGKFGVASIDTANGFDKDEVLRLTAYAENYSTHPIAVSIKEAYKSPIDASSIETYEEIAGHGINAEIEGKNILVGNSKLLNSKNIEHENPSSKVGTIVYLAVDGVFAGCITVCDQIKKDSKDAIKRLKQLGIKKNVMLTGDLKVTSDAIAEEVGIDVAYSELLPQDKVEKFEQIEADQKGENSGKIIFVGDGINDAPVLARADIGVAMGGVGSDAAIEVADIVLMTDELSKIGTAIEIAQKTKKVVWQNIVFAMAVKVVILILVTMGLSTMWEAVFGDVGVTLITILNSMRLLRIKEDK